MKKLNKLLPLASIAGLTAIVAPTLTSCANSVVETFDATADISTTGWTQSKFTEETAPAAFMEYSAACEEDASVFKNDIIFGKHELAEKLPLVLANLDGLFKDPNLFADDEKNEVESFQYTIENLKVSQKLGISVMSLVSNCSIVVTAPETDSSAKTIQRFELDYKLELKDIPFVVKDAHEEGFLPSIGMDLETLHTLYISGMLAKTFEYNLDYKCKAGHYYESKNRFVGSLDRNDKIIFNASRDNFDDIIWMLELLSDDAPLNHLLGMVVYTWESYYFEKTTITK